jgi:hypothetical protein
MGQIPETALHEDTSSHLAPTPWGSFPTPRRMLGKRVYGLGPTNGRIHCKALGTGGQNGCPVVNLRENGQNTRNCVTRGHLKPPRPHPPPHPMGRFPHPQTHVAEADLWVRAHRRAYRAMGMGGRNGLPAEKSLWLHCGPPWRWVGWGRAPRHFLPIYHSKEVLHRLVDQIIGINHSDEVTPPQAPPIYTKTIGNVRNATMWYL